MNLFELVKSGSYGVSGPPSACKTGENRT